MRNKFRQQRWCAQVFFWPSGFWVGCVLFVQLICNLISFCCCLYHYHCYSVFLFQIIYNSRRSHRSSPNLYHAVSNGANMFWFLQIKIYNLYFRYLYSPATKYNTMTSNDSATWSYCSKINLDFPNPRIMSFTFLWGSLYSPNKKRLLVSKNLNFTNISLG